jgi:hypothetical protein
MLNKNSVRDERPCFFKLARLAAQRLLLQRRALISAHPVAFADPRRRYKQERVLRLKNASLRFVLDKYNFEFAPYFRIAYEALPNMS